MSRESVGLLGLGSRSTLHYIEQLNRLYNKKMCGYSTFPFVMINANFDAINSLLPSPSNELDAVLTEYVARLERLEITAILIPNITLHETIDQLKIRKKILHPLILTTNKIIEQEWSTVFLFGSLHTMESNYVSSYLENKGIIVEIPSKEDRLFIDTVRKQVYAGTETPDLIAAYHKMIDKYTEKSPVILACTELSILKPIDNNRIIDMVQLQVEEAIFLTS
jgi:aspartate racemase